MAGESLHTRLTTPAGTNYYVDGANGDVLNGGTSETLRSNAADGQTFGGTDFRLVSASALFVSDDVGHGVMIDVGGTKNYRKIATFTNSTTVTYSGTVIAAGSGRTWRLGGPFKHPQDFNDKTSATSVSPVPGDICNIKEWASTLFTAINSSTTTIVLAASPTALGLPASGTPFSIQLESEADYTFGYDGATDGSTSVLVAATSQAFPTDGSVVNRQVWIQNGAEPGTWEQRTISSVTDSSHLTYSGAAIAVGTDRFWFIIDIEVCTCTSYTTDGGGRAQLTVTRASHLSMANAHSVGVRIDIPYMGKRATSLSDTGARHVVASASSGAGAPFMVQNYVGHKVYFFPNADTAVGTQHETMVFRPAARYWLYRRNPLGGEFAVERARIPASGNVSCVYFAAGAQDCEVDGMLLRFPQQGSCTLSEAVTNCHKYNIRARHPHLHLGFNHHAFYDQGTNCDIVNCVGDCVAYGNSYQNNTSANGGVIAHNTLVQSRGTAAHGTAAVWHEGSSVGMKYKNNCIIDCRRGGYGTTPGAGSGNSFTHNLVRSSQIQDFENSTGGNTSLLDWGNSSNYSALGTGTNLNLTSDPLLVDRYRRNYHPQLGSPLYNVGDLAFTPPKDHEGTSRSSGVATIGAFVAPEELPGAAVTVLRSRRPVGIN